jgi:hypothetical protein
LFICLFALKGQRKIVVMFGNHPERMKMEKPPDSRERNKSGGKAPHSKVFMSLSYLECGALPPLLFPRFSQLPRVEPGFRRNPGTPAKH